VIDFQHGTWYALRIRSRHEKLVSTALTGRGFDCYVPLYRSRRRWTDRFKELDLPLFPGYVFSRFEVRDQLSVLKCTGVTQIVALGRMPVPVDAAELERVQRMVESGLSVMPWPYLAVGERVYLTGGPLEGLEGIISRVKGNFRLVVSVSLLQRSVAVEIDRDWVRPVVAAGYRIQLR
jgi:transcription antitermination factor NusG